MKKGSNDIVLPQVANVAIQTDKIELKKNDFGTQTEDFPIDLSFKVDFQRHLASEIDPFMKKSNNVKIILSIKPKLRKK